MEVGGGLDRDAHMIEQPTIGDCLPKSADWQIVELEHVCEKSSTNISLRSCVVVGSSTLAIFCTEHVRAAGHEVRSVLATDEVFENWAAEQGIHRVNSIAELEAELHEDAVDWLFSVVNPIILAPSIFERVRDKAFNYHDSPLPRYAGTHATTWALIAQETQYAVSWHTISAVVDAGEIAIQQPVPIELHDTALSLNSKCYSAARESFRELLVRLEQGTLVTWPQDTSGRSFYHRTRRPEAGAILDWTQSAATLSAMVRGLDFGEIYPNPLTRPKLRLKTKTVQINQIQLLDQKSTAAPGTIITVGPKGWCVTTRTNDVWISKITTLEGKTINTETLAQDSGLKSGTQLPQLTVEQAQNIRATLESIAPFERFWHDRLRAIQPVALPYEKSATLEAPQWVTGVWYEPLESCTSNPRWHVLGALVTYLARTIGQTRLQLGWRHVWRQELLRIPDILASIVPLQCDIDCRNTFANIIEQIKQEVTCLDKNKTYSRDLVSRYPDLRSIPTLKSAKPWRIVVSMIDFSASEEPLGALLTLQIDTHGRFRWIYDARCLDNTCINRITEHLKELALAAAAHSNSPISQLNMLSAAERKLLVETWNDTKTSYPDEACVNHLFEQQVLKTPNDTAVVYDDQSLSYNQLNARANQLAHKLKSLGLTKGSFIATLLVRSIELVIAELAIVKIGAAYVPLNPAAPPDRQRWIIGDVSAQLLITNIENILFDIPVFRLQEVDLEEMSVENPHTPGSNLDTAYVIYTSGTTGTPKGVLVPHQGIARLTINNPSIGLGPNDRIAFISNPAFDASTFEVWGALLNGATVVVINSESVLDPQLFRYSLLRGRVNVIFLGTALFNHYIDALGDTFPLLDLLLVGGEKLDLRSYGIIFSNKSVKKFVNIYGLTETTTFSIAYLVDGMDHEQNYIPIGRPLSNTRIYLLDAYGQLVPIGVVGEIYIGGDGIASGYQKRPDLTAERFFLDPYSENPEARMYKTGDLGRYLPDGNLLCLGRADTQVKIRGIRVEPSEIETSLMEHSSVRQALVVASGKTEKRLVAYVVVADKICARDLHKFLSTRLPDYMIPSAFVQLDKFPLTMNGKLDMRALPAPDDNAFAHTYYEAPDGPIETTLADIWCNLLGVARVSRHDSFFALGGHSLLAVRLNTRIACLGTEMRLDVLFTNPTLAKMAEAIQMRQSVGSTVRPPIAVIPRDGTLPLSFAQQRLWFLAQLEGVSETYHVPLILRLKGALDMCALQMALNTIWVRHEALRSVFVSVDGQPEVHLLNPDHGIPLRVVKPKEPNQLAMLCTDAAQNPFDLTTGPLIRALLIELTKESYVISMTLHHIVSDGWSLDVLLHELQVLYRAYKNGEVNPLPPLTVQYPDYAFWQRQWLTGERLHQQSAYWKLILSDAPIRLDLPIDRPRPNQQSFIGDFVPIQLDCDLTSNLRNLSKVHGTTMFMTVLAAWAAVLSRLSGQDQVVIGAPSANRGQCEIEPLIGFFVNTLALRVDLRKQPNVAELLSRVKKTVVQAQAHQDLPFEQVVEIVQPPRRLDYTPIFQVIFAWQNNVPAKDEWPGLNIEMMESPYSIAKFELELNLTVTDDQILGGLGYSTALFDKITIQRHANYLLTFLKAMTLSTYYSVDRIDILSLTERELLLKTWNNTQVPFPDQTCINQIFDRQVVQTPEATAILVNGKKTTYAELNVRANKLAHHLMHLGVRPQNYVAILFERSKELIIAQLAILKADAVYVPLDPQSPSERHKWIINDCSACLLLTNTENTNFSIPTLNVNKIDLTTMESLNPVVSGSSLDIAYVMYTSGSTGNPKGVLVTHKGIARLIINNGYAKFKSTDRIGSIANPAFDASTFEIWGALLSGAALVILDRETILSTHEFCRALKSEHINVILLTAGLFNQISTVSLDVFSQLDTLVVGADILDPRSINAVLSSGPPKNFINGYGPTESTTLATSFQINDIINEHCSVPIGKPISNTRIYLLDVYGQPVPLGAVGELYIGGDGVARGYLNRAALTTKHFLPDPFTDVPNARMYRTGDLAKYRNDGNLLFLGRNDYQVKIRGFRIELGEIEARLSTHSTVREAIVIATGEHEKCLIAYVVADAVDPASLREYLTIFLPDYMVPAAFVRLDKMPFTLNGKLDRQALPTPGADAYAHATYEEPIGPVETAIAEIWHDLLGIERISRHDSFFALGGHSLLAVQLSSRIASLGADLPLATLFMAPTLSALAAVIKSKKNTSSASEPLITPITRKGSLPLSFAQQRLWFVAQHGGASEAYHIPLVWHMKGTLHEDALQKAFNTLWARHEALRSIIVSKNGQPEIQLLDPQQGIPLRIYNLKEPSQFAALCSNEAECPFDLSTGPLIRAILIRLTDKVYKLLITQHHIVFDGWSISVLMRELKVLYTAYQYQQINPLPPLVIQYPDYAAWQRQWLRGKWLEDQRDYWRAALADAPMWLNLPTDKPRPPEQSFSGDSVSIELDSELTLNLKRLSQQNGVTLFMTLLSAWSVVLSRLAGQDEIVIGVPSANRGQLQVENLIGFFVNMLAIRVDLRDQPCLRELLTRMKHIAVQAHDHQALPFEEVVEIVQPPRRLDSTPIFQVLFAWQNNQQRSWKWSDLDVTLEDSTYEIVKFDLELNLAEVDDQIVGSLVFPRALFNKNTIERHVNYLKSVLQVFGNDTNTDHPVAMIDIIDPCERQLLIKDWNNTQTPYSEQSCFHYLFEEQVKRTPNCTAIYFEGETLSYSELNARANKLAHRLIELEIKPDTRIAICVKRSPTLIIGFLAILKAGAAYVPLDPAYKSKRLCNILTDADPMIILADDIGRSSLGESALSSRLVVDPSNIFIHHSEANPTIPMLNSRHLAYIIYTSGSTGVPKGVMIEHRSLVNLAEDLTVRFKASSTSRILLFASCGFDAHLFDIAIALNSGASLYLLPEAIRWDEHRLLRYLQEHAPTHVTLPPSLIHAWKDKLDDIIAETIVLEGEVLSTLLFQKLLHKRIVYNGYGLTESTICSTLWQSRLDYIGQIAPIGRPLSNTRVYILDSYHHLVPLGSVGELYIGGDGVARGYLNQADLNAKHFIKDPFSSKPNARMYKTGDLACYLPDGDVLCLGRNDHQIKIRGVRIELGEIEAKLIEHTAVHEVVVIAIGELNDRIVAYVVADDIMPIELREYLSIHLPDFMIPTYFVKLSALPITSTGKLDRRALPLPDDKALPYAIYEKPIGKVEIILAAIWRQVLGIDKVSRHDSFFALGGHSLLAVEVIERLREEGLNLSVRSLFQTPVLTTLAGTLNQHIEAPIPPNVITEKTNYITPAMLPLIDLTQDDIERIALYVPGGFTNVQDIYALSPLQDGILFHHLLTTDSDPYLGITQKVFKERANLDHYLTAIQEVINRHDILRTAFVWKKLSKPVQVVWRNAPLSITELKLDPKDGSISDQLTQRYNPGRYKIDLTQAPLVRFVIAHDEVEHRWILLFSFHHLIVDHVTLAIMQAEAQAFLDNRGDTLPPAEPYRDIIALIRSRMDDEAHEKFFRHMLATVSEPTLIYGLTDLHQDGSQITESHCMLPNELNLKLRTQAQLLNVSLASLCHVAYGQVLARISGQENVVFNTVLFGRMQTRKRSNHAVGNFINALPLRIDLCETSVTQSVRTTHLRLAELLEHEHASLVLARRCSGVIDGGPLTNALLNYRHHAVGSSFNSMDAEFLRAVERTNFPITMSVENFGTALGLTAQVQLPVEPDRFCGYMEQSLVSLSEALESSPDLPVRELQILPSAERELLLKTWNDTKHDYPEHECLHHLFEQQVERTPDSVAILFGSSQLTYAQLNAQANQLARQLLKHNVEPNTLAAICVNRSPAMVVGLLAILKAGAAYVPLNPNDLSERLTQILSDANPRFVLADEVGRKTLADAVNTKILIDPSGNFAEPKGNLLIPSLTSRDRAYVMYTSGSTGVPKGVPIEHQSLINRLMWMRHVFPLSPGDRFLQKTSFTFDVSVWEIFLTLICGATMVIVPPEVHQDSLALSEIIAEQKVTIAFFVPSMLTIFLKVAPRKDYDYLRRVICSGEELSPMTIQLCQEKLPHARIFNLYGPTEATINVTYWSCPSHFTERYVPIGRPIWNTKIYLLDRDEQPVPLGAIGELYISGSGIARGYLNLEKLTAERFRLDPFDECSSMRMYKTGDLARYLPDGNLIYCGRVDRQMKIRGVRIEPGEIEAKLMMHAAVQQAVVVTVPEPDHRLIAYVVADDIDAIALYEYLRSLLPYYMIPSAIKKIDTLPYMTNGKLNYRALPALDANEFVHAAYEEPIGPTETLLAEVWSNALGVKQVSRHDSFFALGGHSLLIVQMIERLREQNWCLEISDVFRTPTLATLAATLKLYDGVRIPPNEINQETLYITPDLLPLINLTEDDISNIIERVPGGVANIQDIYALTPLQEGILFHHLLSSNSDPYLITTQMAFAKRATLNRYLAAIQQVVDRNDVLRTAFIWEGISNPAQVVWRKTQLSITELTLHPEDGLFAEQLKQRFDSRQYRMDLTHAPLLRFVIAEDRTENQWILLILYHHLIGDHTTFDIMHEEIQAFFEDRGYTLAPPEPFRNFIAQVRMGMSSEAHELFFRQMLAGITEPTLPFGLADVHRNGSQITEAHRMLSTVLNRKLRAQALRLNVSVASLCYVAWALVLSRTSSQLRVVFATVLLGRMHAGKGSQRAMGLFINTLPFRIDIDKYNVVELIRKTHFQFAELLEHEHASLALAQRCSDVPVSMPLTSALLNYRHNEKRNSIRGLDTEVIGAQERTSFPFTLSIEDSGTALGMTAQVQLPVEPERVCGYMEQALISLVEALEYAPNQAVQELEILNQGERELLLRTWNATQTPYPNEACIHHLFEKQTDRLPNETAIAYGKIAFSYEDLNIRANNLARRLIQLNVKLEGRVAICMERSPAMIASIFAVLKAGAAYVPLDPSYPYERLAYILTDADPVVILADAVGRKALNNASLGRTTLDPNDEFLTSGSNLHCHGLTARHLAYIIYTSGSTGMPKGVMIEHRSIVNYSCYAIQRYESCHGKGSAMVSPIAFDSTLTALFPTLLSGRTLYLPITNDDPIALRPTILGASKLSPVKLTPSHLALLQDELSIRTIGEHIHTLVLGGEVPSNSVLQRWHKHAPKTRIFNEYGPTETTVGCVVHEVVHPIMLNGFIPIGRPIANTRIYLIDRFGQLVPLGVDGEICIGGHGVARGYLNLPDLSTERFVPDPFVDDPDARMYKTGDLGRYLPDGTLVFLGRNDNQIKIRGFRVEPGEIESRLSEHPAVHEAVVVALGESDKRLVAYIIADEINTLALIQYLRTYLPEYMIPSSFVKIDSFPLTPNGKLDHRALPAPNQTCWNRTIEAPIGPIEIALAEIWSGLLGIEGISRRDSFFALGGHSILAITMIQRATRCGLCCSLNELFEQPILADFASRITSATLTVGHTQAIPIRSTGSEFPLFFVPTGLGDHSYIFSLARYIPSRYPVYALPWPFTSESSQCTIQDLAGVMVSFIKAVQPKGPYRISGYSAGGVLAYAVAELLLGHDETVAFVGLIDVAPPHMLRNLSTTHLFFEYLAVHADHEIFIKIVDTIKELDETDCHNFICNPEQMQSLGTNLPHELVISAWKRVKSFVEAARSYEPLFPPSNIYLFHSTEVYHPRSWVDEKHAMLSENVLIDEWKKSHTFVQFVPVPGDHWTMMTEAPNRKKLGETFNRVLETLSNNCSELSNNSEEILDDPILQEDS